MYNLIYTTDELEHNVYSKRVIFFVLFKRYKFVYLMKRTYNERRQEGDLEILCSFARIRRAL